MKTDGPSIQPVLPTNKTWQKVGLAVQVHTLVHSVRDTNRSENLPLAPDPLASNALAKMMDTLTSALGKKMNTEDHRLI